MDWFSDFFFHNYWPVFELKVQLEVILLYMCKKEFSQMQAIILSPEIHLANKIKSISMESTASSLSSLSQKQLFIRILSETFVCVEVPPLNTIS